MTDTDVRPSLNASSATAVLDRLRAGPRAEPKLHLLSPEARAVADAPTPTPISPIVLAGAVRMAEFALIVVVGLAVFAAYLPPFDGLIWRYIVAIFAIALLSMFAFQTADINQVQAFRGHEKQYMRLASAWSVVFLIVIGASFFAKAGEMFSRVWLGTFYVSGLCALILSRKLLFLLVRKWTREGRLTRRTVIVGGGDPGAHVIEAGTGSGGLTLALARFVRPEGRIYTYEEREEMVENARKNLERFDALVRRIVEIVESASAVELEPTDQGRHPLREVRRQQRPEIVSRCGVARGEGHEHLASGHTACDAGPAQRGLDRLEARWAGPAFVPVEHHHRVAVDECVLGLVVEVGEDPVVSTDFDGGNQGEPGADGVRGLVHQALGK